MSSDPRGGLGRDPRWLELTSGLLAVAWAAVALAAPEPMAEHPGLAVVSAFAPGWVWAALALAAGAVQAAAAACDHIEARVLAALATGGLWLLLFDGVALAAPWSPGLALYGGLGAANAAAALVLVQTWLGGRAA